ncbi:MAG TPA: diacylglycerol kinase family protein [Bacilli bacterium]
MNALGRWLRSVRYAVDGLKYILLTQPNMRIHFGAALIVLTLSWLLRIGETKILFLLLAITIVTVTEAVNTAVEKAVDLASREIHPLAKIAKDVAAAAVLLAAVFAVVTGIVVFWQPVVDAFGGSFAEPGMSGLFRALILLIVTALAAFLLQTAGSRKKGGESGRFSAPSVPVALAWTAAGWISLAAARREMMLLALFLAALASVLFLERSKASLFAVATGAGLGILIAVIGYITI